MNKKEIAREKFRNAVFERDRFACAVCGYRPKNCDELDSHHITSRNLMPFGGYVPSNGISLCTDRSPGSPDCHRKAESLHETGVSISGYAPADLYAKIKSSHWKAYFDCLKENIDPIKVRSIYNNFRLVHEEELRTCIVLGCTPNSTTWELSCEAVNVSDPLVDIYGKGRLYAADGGAKGCHQEDYGGTW